MSVLNLLRGKIMMPVAAAAAKLTGSSQATIFDELAVSKSALWRPLGVTYGEAPHLTPVTGAAVPVVMHGQPACALIEHVTLWLVGDCVPLKACLWQAI
jgi:hypothetical protein